MLNKKNIFFILFQILFCYSVFDHTYDFKIPSSTSLASSNTENFYNFYNPACNKIYQNKFLHSSFGDYFNGLLKNQTMYFSINSKLFDILNFSIIKSSIDNIYNTTDAWNDDGDGLIDISEIDYDNITNFNHNTLGLIISKSFILDNKYKIFELFHKPNIQYGINSKFSISSLVSENSFSHSFDLGLMYYSPKFLSSFFYPNIGLLIQDFLPYSYWSTGQIDKQKTAVILGSSFGFMKDIESSKHFFYFNNDFNLSILDNSSVGIEYKFISNNNSISILTNTSKIQNLFGFIIRFNNNFDIAYSYMIPNNKELTSSQKIILGINKDMLKNYIK